MQMGTAQGNDMYVPQNQWSFGSTFIRSYSIFPGSSSFVRAQLPGNTLYMGIHHNTGFIVYIPRITLAVLRPTPARGGQLLYGSWHLSSKPFHQVPAAGNDILSFHVIKPNGWISCSNSFKSAAANFSRVSYFWNKSAVTIFTLASVHWALMITAISSCQGVS